ncbi:MAG: acetyl-CoA carboxylase biotin carboxylase subunit [Legionellales bacterium]|nr:acetyl-CoA carboxylase biotin carboxylase subunit [Legionellales bacterium]
MLNKVVVANRGEIALRIIRACRELGIKTVAVYSEADQGSIHVGLADEALCIGPAQPLKSYLNHAAILSVAEITGADAIHPGYGFLSENADFCEQVENSGFIFIGPRSETIRLMANKVSAIQAMRRAGVPCLDSSPVLNNLSNPAIEQLADGIGYPILLKAAQGGGGRGMHIVHEPSKLIDEYQSAKLEALSAFGDDSIFMEKFLTNPSHIEVQVLCDHAGNALHFGERECSIQRRNQKIIEEATAGFKITDQQRDKIGRICVSACRDIGYIGAGTFEFLYQEGEFYFIEMNTRIQVEHPVTEMITNVDLVKSQIEIASGLPLPFQQSDIHMTGHAIECRINAENPFDFTPSPGLVSMVHYPGGNGVRFDSHIYSGYQIPHYYDSMIGKLICYAKTREAAIDKMYSALDELIIEGVETNIPLHKEILSDESFIKGKTHIHFLLEFFESFTETVADL